MTVCGRPQYLAPVLEGWSQVEGVEDWPMIFMVEPTVKKPEMLALLDAFDHPNKLIVENPVRLGVLRNPHAGLSLAFEKLNYEFVVLAEEDLLPSTCVLQYFDFVSREYRDDTEVLTTGVDPSTVAESPEVVRKIQEFTPWIWATWSDRWPLISRTWDKNYSSGEPSGWDWNLTLRVLPDNNLTAVFPGKSLVRNLGEFQGSHADPRDFQSTQKADFQQHCSYQWYKDG